MSGVSVNLMRELCFVNPLSQPARDELIGRKYVYLSSPTTENARFQLGAVLDFTVNPPQEEEHDTENGEKKKRKKKNPVKEQGGLVTLELLDGPGGGEGKWMSCGKDSLLVVWEGAEEEESMRVLYLDRDLLILQDGDADEGGSMPYVLQVAS